MVISLRRGRVATRIVAGLQSNYYSIFGSYRDNGNMEATIVYWGKGIELGAFQAAP